MKYMGSKSRITKYIVPILQKYIDDNNIKKYVEPFVGGANVIDKIKCEERYGYDKNKYLIALLQRVQDFYDIDNCGLLKEVPRDVYNNAREQLKIGIQLDEDWYIGNIGFLASYNGRWFDGGYAQSGYEKTKNGERFRDYYQEAKNNLLSQVKDIKDIQFGVSDYKNTIELSLSYDSGIVIYCDPPYQGTKQYDNAKNFDYEEFWNIIREWSKNNIVLVSEQNAPNDFKCIWKQEVSRSIKATDKSKSVEKLFIHNIKL